MAREGVEIYGCCGEDYVGLERGEISDCPNGQGTDTKPAILIGETTSKQMVKISHDIPDQTVRN